MVTPIGTYRIAGDFFSDALVSCHRRYGTSRSPGCFKPGNARELASVSPLVRFAPGFDYGNGVRVANGGFAYFLAVTPLATPTPFPFSFGHDPGPLGTAALGTCPADSEPLRYRCTDRRCIQAGHNHALHRSTGSRRFLQIQTRLPVPGERYRSAGNATPVIPSLYFCSKSITANIVLCTQLA